MATILTLSHPDVTIENGRAVTTSVAIAEFFGKRHERVLDKIRNLDCSAKFTEHNFVSSEYTDSTGRKLPMYQITKNGFVFLVMGFTGKKAATFKEAYIAEFDRMEEELRQNNAPSPDKMIHGDGRTWLSVSTNTAISNSLKPFLTAQWSAPWIPSGFIWRNKDGLL